MPQIQAALKSRFSKVNLFSRVTILLAQRSSAVAVGSKGTRFEEAKKQMVVDISETASGDAAILHPTRGFPVSNSRRIRIQKTNDSIAVSYYPLAPARIYFNYRFVGMKYFKKSNIMSSSSTLLCTLVEFWVVLHTSSARWRGTATVPLLLTRC